MSTAFALVFVRADDILSYRDAVQRHALGIERMRAAVPVLRVAGSIPFDRAAMQIRIATRPPPVVERQNQLGRVNISRI